MQPTPPDALPELASRLLVQIDRACTCRLDKFGERHAVFGISEQREHQRHFSIIQPGHLAVLAVSCLLAEQRALPHRCRGAVHGPCALEPRVRLALSASNRGSCSLRAAPRGLVNCTVSWLPFTQAAEISQDLIARFA